MAKFNPIPYIRARAAQLGLDPNAVLAIAHHEGLGGGVGDNGTSFGPWQLHEGGALPKNIPLSQAQQWAWSRQGIDYALGQMAKDGAAGLTGRSAVNAISRNFERPANPGAEIADAMSVYGKVGGKGPSLSLGGQAGAAPTLPGMSGGLGGAQQALAAMMLAQSSQTAQGQFDPQSLLGMAMLRQQMAAAQNVYGGAPAQGQTAPAQQGSTKLSVGSLAGGFLPKGASYKAGRLDQGHDFQTNPGGAIVAPGDGVVLSVKSDPHGFGPSYPVVHFTSGPYKGHDIYIGHTISQLRPGQSFSAGQVLSRTGTSPIGNATVPGWAEIGYAPGGMPGDFGQTAPF